jgi:hypothetical protein
MRVTRRARVLAALGLGLSAPALAAVAAARPAAPHVATTVLAVPSGLDPSEPHLAVDPEDQGRLFAVAQLVVPRIGAPKEVLWRSRNGGASWQSTGLLGGVANDRRGISGDPVVAAGDDGLVLYGTLTFDPDPASGTAAQAVGARISTDGGRSFTAFGTADRATAPLCFLEGSCEGPPPPGLFLLDKPWLAVDSNSVAFRGSAS